MKLDKDVEILWQDRIRHFGMPISFTKYILARKGDLWIKLFIKKGFLTTQIDEVNFYRIYDLTTYVSLGAKIFRCGTVELYCDDASHQKINLTNIKNPYKVHRLFADLIEQEKKNRRFYISEIQN